MSLRNNIFRRERGFYRDLFKLAVPMVLQNLINNMLSLLDTFMVGSLGNAEMAAVMLAGNVFFVLGLLFFGIQSGMAILISQYWGKRDTAAISRVLGLGLMAAGGLSLLGSVVVSVFPRAVMGLITNDAILIDFGTDFLSVVAPSYVFNAVALTLASAFRSMENPRVGLAVVAGAAVCNTFLNYILIFGNIGAPKMGVKGAGLSTLIVCIGEFAAMLLYLIFNKRFRVKVACLLKPGVVITRDFIRYSLPVIANETLWGFGYSLYSVIVGHMDGAAASAAAFTVATSIDRILGAPTFGIGMSVAVVIGKNLGGGASGKDAYSLGKTLVATTALAGLACALLSVAVSTFAVKPLLPVFFDMSETEARLAWILLLILSLKMPLSAVNMSVIVGVLRGGGDVRVAALIDLSCLYCVGLVFAYIFGLKLEFGVVLVFFGMAAEEFSKIFGSIARFRAKRWIKNLTRSL
ncbi:MATE family efflux transporter [Clostridia bacterium]|nr:MATE family efflux transporter [Clostridia bacterium]